MRLLLCQQNKDTKEISFHYLYRQVQEEGKPVKYERFFFLIPGKHVVANLGKGKDCGAPNWKEALKEVDDDLPEEQRTKTLRVQYTKTLTPKQMVDQAVQNIYKSVDVDGVELTQGGEVAKVTRSSTNTGGKAPADADEAEMNRKLVKVQKDNQQLIDALMNFRTRYTALLGGARYDRKWLVPLDGDVKSEKESTGPGRGRRPKSLNPENNPGQVQALEKTVKDLKAQLTQAKKAKAQPSQSADTVSRESHDSAIRSRDDRLADLAEQLKQVNGEIPVLKAQVEKLQAQLDAKDELANEKVKRVKAEAGMRAMAMTMQAQAGGTGFNVSQFLDQSYSQGSPIPGTQQRFPQQPYPFLTRIRRRESPRIKEQKSRRVVESPSFPHS